MLLTYVNGSPVFLGQARAALGMNNNNFVIGTRTSTNPVVGTVNRRLLPPLGTVYNGLRSTYPAWGAGGVAIGDTNAQIADRVLNSSDSQNVISGKYDLRRYRGLNLASGPYNNPYNTDPGYGSAYAFSNQYPDGNYFPYNGQRPAPLSGPYSGPDFDNYGNRLNDACDVSGPDAARGFNIDMNRGYNCDLITGVQPDAARGFNVDPCTGYNKYPYRGCLGNAYGGDIAKPFRGLNCNPCTGGPIGSDPCGPCSSPYGTGSIFGNSRFLNNPYGISQFSTPYSAIYPSTYGISQFGGSI